MSPEKIKEMQHMVFDSLVENLLLVPSLPAPLEAYAPVKAKTEFRRCSVDWDGCDLSVEYTYTPDGEDGAYDQFDITQVCFESDKGVGGEYLSRNIEPFLSGYVLSKLMEKVSIKNENGEWFDAKMEVRL